MTLPLKAYTASLPQKRMGAGCLFFDKYGKILLVKPTYKSGWEIPGGVVELNESPKQCYQREIQEEIRLQHEVGRLLVVDYNPETDQKTESLMFIFDGGTLTATDIASIQLPEGELQEFGFFEPHSLPEMEKTLQYRILTAVEQSAKGTDAYMENLIHT